MPPVTLLALKVEFAGINAALSVASKTQQPSFSACRHLITLVENAVLFEYVNFRISRLMCSTDAPSSSLATNAAINDDNPGIGDLTGVNVKVGPEADRPGSASVKVRDAQACARSISG